MTQETIASHLWPFLLFSVSAMCAPIGNPASPAILQEGLLIPDTFWCQPRIEFCEDFTVEHLLRSPTSVQKSFLQSRAELASLIWSIKERFDLSLILGSGQNFLRLYQSSNLLEFYSQNGLIWYGEAKLILFEMKDTTLAIFGEAGGWDWMSGPSYIKNQASSHTHLQMRFWEAGPALVQRIRIFSPYIGAVVLRSRWKLTGKRTETFRFHQKYSVGPFLGCSISSPFRCLLNVEWRGWIENAWSVSGQIRF